MSVQNFHLTAQIDGRSTNLNGGPRAKDGGFSLQVKIRDNGSIACAADVNGHAYPDGRLMVRIIPRDGTVTYHKDGSITIETRR